VKSTFKPGQENPGGDELSANGTTSGFSAGFGYKFFTGKGFAVRAIADYYFRTEKYEEDDLTNTFNKDVGGPRCPFTINPGQRIPTITRPVIQLIQVLV
jgi:hypothetical protein